jgi:hypothetical protein
MEKIRENAYEVLEREWQEYISVHGEICFYNFVFDELMGSRGRESFLQWLFDSNKPIDELTESQEKEFKNLIKKIERDLVETTVQSLWSWLTIENKMDSDAYFAIESELPESCWRDEDDEEDDEYPHGESATWGLAVDEEGNEYAYFIPDNFNTEFNNVAYYLLLNDVE